MHPCHIFQRLEDVREIGRLVSFLFHQCVLLRYPTKRFLKYSLPHLFPDGFMSELKRNIVMCELIKVDLFGSFSWKLKLKKVFGNETLFHEFMRCYWLHEISAETNCLFSNFSDIFAPPITRGINFTTSALRNFELSFCWSIKLESLKFLNP